MGMIPYDVRSTVSRYSSCSEHSTTIHAFRSATNEGVSSRPMNDIRALYLKQTKMTYFPKNKVLQKKYSFEEAICRTGFSWLVQWGLRFKRALFKRIVGLREVKMTWHNTLLNRTHILFNRTYPKTPCLVQHCHLKA